MQFEATKYLSPDETCTRADNKSRVLTLNSSRTICDGSLAAIFAAAAQRPSSGKKNFTDRFEMSMTAIPELK